MEITNDTRITHSFNPKQEDCIVCQTINKSQNTKNIQQALYLKYSESIDIYYRIQINDLLIKRQCKSYIIYRDSLDWDDQNSYLQKYHSHSDASQNMLVIIKFYSFHKVTPRIFFHTLQPILSKYYRKQIKIEYKRVQQILYPHKTQLKAHPIYHSFLKFLGNNSDSSPGKEFRKSSNSIKSLRKKLSYFLQCQSSYSSMNIEPFTENEQKPNFSQSEQSIKNEIKKGQLMGLYQNFIMKHQMRNIEQEKPDLKEIQEQTKSNQKPNNSNLRSSRPSINKILTARKFLNDHLVNNEKLEILQRAEKEMFEKIQKISQPKPQQKLDISEVIELKIPQQDFNNQIIEQIKPKVQKNTKSQALINPKKHYQRFYQTQSSSIDKSLQNALKYNILKLPNDEIKFFYDNSKQRSQSVNKDKKKQESLKKSLQKSLQKNLQKIIKKTITDTIQNTLQSTIQKTLSRNSQIINRSVYNSQSRQASVYNSQSRQVSNQGSQYNILSKKNSKDYQRVLVKEKNKSEYQSLTNR